MIDECHVKYFDNVNVICFNAITSFLFVKLSNDKYVNYKNQSCK